MVIIVSDSSLFLEGGIFQSKSFKVAGADCHCGEDAPTIKDVIRHGIASLG